GGGRGGSDAFGREVVGDGGAGRKQTSVRLRAAGADPAPLAARMRLPQLAVAANLLVLEEGRQRWQGGASVCRHGGILGACVENFSGVCVSRAAAFGSQ